jgi:putative flippase GtrA
VSRGGPLTAAQAGARLFDLRLLGRHQAAAAFATGIDFTTMVALVELAHTPPPFATLLSATAGGITNFVVSRLWAFRHRHRGSVPAQAARYALACAGGALLNATLLAAVLAAAHPPYLAARVAISIVVSIAYTYPLHTRFVFRALNDVGQREQS